MLITKLKNQSGFSFIEITFSIAIFSIGILGVFAAILQSIQVQTVNRGYLVASMLAQEGIEIVRNQRDANWLNFEGGSPHPWDEFITDGGSLTFTVDHDQTVAYNYGCNDVADNCAVLYLENGANLYTTEAAGNTATPYHRLITVNEDASGNFFTVTCTVEWSERNRTHDYTAETRLYNWRGA